MMSFKLWYRRCRLAAGLCALASLATAQQFNYVPTSVYYCQLERKYDSSLSGGLSRGGKANGTEWQAAFSPIRQGLVVINYFDAYRKGVKTQVDEGSSARFAEIGLGFYEPTEKGVASLLVGLGQGSIFSNYSLRRAATFNLQRWFVQPAVLFKRDNFEWGFALRLNRLIYTHANVDYSIADYDLQIIQAIDAKPSFFLPELGLHFGVRLFKPVMCAVNLTNLFYQSSAYNFEQSNATFLLTVDLGSFYQPEKNNR